MHNDARVLLKHFILRNFLFAYFTKYIENKFEVLKEGRPALFQVRFA